MSDICTNLCSRCRDTLLSYPSLESSVAVSNSTIDTLGSLITNHSAGGAFDRTYVAAN
jgi:hypothetical protein